MFLNTSHLIRLKDYTLWGVLIRQGLEATSSVCCCPSLQSLRPRFTFLRSIMVAYFQYQPCVKVHRNWHMSSTDIHKALMLGCVWAEAVIYNVMVGTKPAEVTKTGCFNHLDLLMSFVCLLVCVMLLCFILAMHFPSIIVQFCWNVCH